MVRVFGTHLIVNSPSDRSLVYLFSQRKMKEPPYLLDPNKALKDPKRLDEVIASPESQQILEISYQDSLDFDRLSQASVPKTQDEQSKLSYQRRMMTLFLNKLMHVLMMRLNYFKLSEDHDDYVFYHKKDFVKIDNQKILGTDIDLS